MNPCGLTDSLANVQHEAVKCASCGGVSRLASGVCLSCLMQVGLDPGDENFRESFKSILAKIDIHDGDWRIGHYEILEELGRGGMGVIYRARQQFSRRVVALKRVLNCHSDSPETLARFRREAEAASILDHPNILPIYEVGESEDGLPFFAMKFAPGGSLRDVGPALNRAPDRVVPLMLRVARAVQSAHAQGLLHRDLKPGNILLDGRGEPLVSDFGLAKWLDSSSDLTRTLTIFGTPGYIAPEQARGSATRLGATADVYSLGAILFDLLAGRPPFLGEHALAVIAQAAEQRAPRLRSVAPSIDRDLETICARCLEGDPSARYSTAGKLADDLERWLEGKPILARPVSAPIRIWRWTRRNPALAASCAACFILAALSWPKFSEHRQYQASLLRAAAWQHSVTVLPFLDLDNASADDRSASEITGILRSCLSTIGPCRVVQTESRHLVFAAAPRGDEIATAARQAQVRTVLTGTKRLVNGKPFFSVRLARPAEPNAILARSKQVDPDGTTLGNLFQKNSAELYKLIGASFDQVPNVEANKTSSDFISAGRVLMDRRTVPDSDRAIDCFEKAIGADPSSAQAHAFLAIARIGRWFFGGRPELLQLAETAAKKAVELEPQFGGGHRALSTVLEQKGEVAEAGEEGFRAIELDGVEERSASRIATTMKMLGRPDIALAWLRMMKHLQNQPARGEFLIGDCWTDLCADELAEQAYRQTMELRPDLPEGWIGICRLRMLKGDFAAALQVCSENEKNFSQFSFTSPMIAQVHFFARHSNEAKKIYSDLALKDPPGGGKFYGAMSHESALGWLYLAAGEEEIGRKILNQALRRELQQLAAAPNHPEILYRTAAVEATLSLKNAALEHLRAAMGAGWMDFRSLALDPRFDALRGDTMFAQISESMATKVASLRRSMPTDLSGANERSNR